MISFCTVTHLKIKKRRGDERYTERARLNINRFDGSLKISRIVWERKNSTVKFKLRVLFQKLIKKVIATRIKRSRICTLKWRKNGFKYHSRYGKSSSCKSRVSSLDRWAKRIWSSSQNDWIIEKIKSWRKYQII